MLVRCKIDLFNFSKPKYINIFRSLFLSLK